MTTTTEGRVVRNGDDEGPDRSAPSTSSRRWRVAALLMLLPILDSMLGLLPPSHAKASDPTDQGAPIGLFTQLGLAERGTRAFAPGVVSDGLWRRPIPWAPG